MPVERIDAFVASKKEWLQKPRGQLAPVHVSTEECLKVFNLISDKYYPHFAPYLKGRPLIKAQFMKTRWGVCHVNKNTIVLNSALLLKPLAAIEYVVAHEYTHFLHPNHQKGFYDALSKIMPDYRQRRQLLKGGE